MKRILPVSLIVVLFVTLVQPASAHHRKAVLGEATASAEEVEFPAVTAGPGILLPDNPLYPLDEFSQNFRLATAFTPEAKAKVRTQIAQERLAELRVMMNKNNEKGINTALTELTKESAAAAKQVSEAKAKGRNVDAVAKEVNDTIKVQRQVLGVVEDQTDGALQLRIKTARAELRDAKVTVEDALPEDELQNEIQDDLHESVDEHVEETDTNADELERHLDQLEKEASEAAKESLKHREDALKEAIEHP